MSFEIVTSLFDRNWVPSPDFKVPIMLDRTSTCQTRNNLVVEMCPLKHFFWNEDSVTNKHTFEVVDRTLRA